MKMIIANCTSQNHTLNYQIPEEQRPISHPIPMGKQDYVGGSFRTDLSPPQIEGVVTQLAPYGLMAVKDLNRMPDRVVPYVWDDKPITIATIRRVMDHNTGVKVDEGKNRRKLAAISGNDALERAISEAADTPKVEVFTLEVEEVDNNAHETDDTKLVKEGFVVDNKTGSGPERPPRQQRRRAA